MLRPLGSALSNSSTVHRGFSEATDYELTLNSH